MEHRLQATAPDLLVNALEPSLQRIPGPVDGARHLQQSILGNVGNLWRKAALMSPQSPRSGVGQNHVGHELRCCRGVCANVVGLFQVTMDTQPVTSAPGAHRPRCSGVERHDLDFLPRRLRSLYRLLAGHDANRRSSCTLASTPSFVKVQLLAGTCLLSFLLELVAQLLRTTTAYCLLTRRFMVVQYAKISRVRLSASK